MSFPSAAGLLAGRPVCAALLDHGRFRVTAAARPREMGIPGLLIGTDAGEWVLVDGGFPAKYLADPDAAAAEDGLGAFGEILSLVPRNAPAAQMALCGVAPEDLTAQILTHTHIDHLGGLGLARVPVVIGAAERAMARPDPQFQPQGAPMEWPDLDWRLAEGDTALGPGLTALAAPGHAPGQIALLVEPEGERPLLYASDAASRPEEVAEGFIEAAEAKRPALVASARRLLDIAEARDAEVIWGHCIRQWRDIPKAPDYLRGAAPEEARAWAV